MTGRADKAHPPRSPGRRLRGAPRPRRPGAVLAPGYRVVAHLRRGLDVDVYDAVSDVRRCRCIVKTARPDRRGEPAVVRGLAREARMLRSLTHPNIVRAYELVPGEAPLLVLETLGGVTLSYAFETQGRLALADVGELGRQLGSAAGYLHDAGLIHLDLKPSNIIAEAGRARVIDLGIARRPGRVPKGLGTPGYMSPEQEDGGVIGPASDVWGMAVVLYEAATGQRALPRKGPPWGAPPPVRTLRRMPPRLGEAIDAALSRDPAMRPGLDELVSALGPAEG